MRITRTILKQWGPHEKLDLEMDSPVYGLLGENGCGKTNILEAIGFAFTGGLERTQETYAREVGGVRQPNGSVEIHFNKDGLIGKIFRQVGTSPRRWMEWDGEKYTKSADIDRILQEILDCDKKAVDMAVFLSQGHIGDFLFTTASVREDMFSKLCLIDHLSGVADIAGQKIQDLQRTVTDLTSVKDEAMMNKQAAMDTLRTEEGELALHVDQTPVLNWLKNRIQKLENVDTANAALQRQYGVLQVAQNKAAQRQRPAFLDTTTSPADALRAEEEKAYAFDTASQKLNDVRAQLQRRQADEQRIVGLNLQLTTLRISMQEVPVLQGELTTLQSAIVDSRKRVDTQRGDITAAREFHNLRLGQEGVRNRLVQAQDTAAKTTEALAKLPTFDILDLLEGQIKKELDELMPQGLGLKLAQQVAGKVSGGCCPLCKNTDLSKLPEGEELQRQVDAFKEKHGTLTANQTLYSTQRNNRSLLETQLASQKQEVGAAQAAVAAQVVLPVCPPQLQDYSSLTAAEAALQASENTLRQQEALWVTKEGEIAKLRAQELQIDEMNKSLTALTALTNEAPSVETLMGQISQLESSLQGRELIAGRIVELRNFIQGFDADQKTVEAEQTQLERLTKEAAVAVTSLESTIPGAKQDWLVGDIFATRAELVSREQQQQLRIQQEGKVKACTDALRRAEGRVAEVEDRIQGNARTREVINQLEQIREAFGRSGIPRHYLTQIFDALVAGTQENLTNWDSDFQVERDELKLFNFRFYRSNDPETLLDQSQLSGGQKMRLSISFLLAVQQLVMPELGFIVLDEPTYGLDPAGIEGLGALFRHMAVHLADINSQVIVVTHEDILKSSLSKSVTLKPVSELQ